MKFSLVSLTAVFLSLAGTTKSFSASNGPDRRSFLVGGVSGIVTSLLVPSQQPAYAEYRLGDKNSVVGREIASFNDLIYNFKNTALDGGLDASTLNEPSVSFIEFGDRLRKGEVEMVEFLAPSGQVAYVTFKKSGSTKGLNLNKGKKGGTAVAKSSSGERIRIGQGYPTGGKNSWSSPDYVIRSVSNFGVPYKFTVPALASAKYKKN